MLRAWHRWLGLSIALYLLFQGATGVLLVYRHELQALWSQSVTIHTGSVPPISIQSILENIEARYPAHVIDRIYYPAVRDEPYVAHLRSVDESATELVEIDPYTGRVLEAAFAIHALELIFDLHHELSLGKSGAYVVGLIGLAVLALAVTGLYLWWPGIRRLGSTFKVRLKGAGIRSLYDWHRLTGSVLALLIVVSASTGFLLAYGGPLRTALGISETPVEAVARNPTGLALRADTLISIADAAVPNSGVRDIRFQDAGNVLRTVVFFRDGDSRSGPFHRVSVDPYNGRVLGVSNSRKLDAGNTFFAWIYPIHTDLGLAKPGKAIVAAGGIGLLLLGVTGPLLWWRKRARRFGR